MLDSGQATLAYRYSSNLSGAFVVLPVEVVLTKSVTRAVPN